MPEQAANPGALAYQHRPSIGGSDIGALLGVNRYRNAASVYDRVRTLLDGGTLPLSGDSNDTERGRELEAAAARKFEREKDRVCVHPGAVVTHETRPYMHANPDRLIVRVRETDPFYDCGTGILEIKVPRLANFRATLDAGVDPSYYVQLQHYLAVTGMRWGSFAFLNAEDWLLHVVDVPRDEDTIEDIFHACDRFWNMVQNRERPDAPIQEATAIRQRAATTTDRVTRDTSPWIAAMIGLKSAREEFAIANTRKQLAEDAIKAMMELDGIEQVIIPGQGRISYREETRTSFDMDAFSQAHPEIDMEQYRRRTATRAFRPTFGR